MLMIRGFKSYLNVDVDDISRINVAKEEVCKYIPTKEYSV